MIDWNFLESVEKRSLKGYVPCDKDGPIGHSGVTIATGVDLGQFTSETFTDHFANISLPTQNKLLPYVSLKRYDALQALEKSPLEIDELEAQLLDSIVQLSVLRTLRQDWKKAVGWEYDKLPNAVQTALYSLSYNLGRLAKKYPHTWDTFVEAANIGNWTKAYLWLVNFPSKQVQLKARRAKEAELIRPLATVDDIE